MAKTGAKVKTVERMHCNFIGKDETLFNLYFKVDVGLGEIPALTYEFRRIVLPCIYTTAGFSGECYDGFSIRRLS